MFAMFLTALVLRCSLSRRPYLVGPFASLEKSLYLMLELCDQTTQFSILRLKLGNPFVAWVFMIHTFWQRSWTLARAA